VNDLYQSKAISSFWPNIFSQKLFSTSNNTKRRSKKKHIVETYKHKQKHQLTKQAHQRKTKQKHTH
jgi:hypothetical protein